MRDQVSLLVFLCFSITAGAQCKQDIEPNDKVVEIKAALVCWKKYSDSKAADLERMTLKLRESTITLEKQKTKSPASGSLDRAAELSTKLLAIEAENRRLRSEISGRTAKLAVSPNVPMIFSLQSNPFDPKKSNCFSAATQVLASLEARDIKTEADLAISGIIGSHRVEVTCWLDDLIILTAAGPEPLQIVKRVNESIEKFRK